MNLLIPSVRPSTPHFVVELSLLIEYLGHPPAASAIPRIMVSNLLYSLGRI
jgi:hypothetical protein